MSLAKQGRKSPTFQSVGTKEEVKEEVVVEPEVVTEVADTVEIPVVDSSNENPLDSILGTVTRKPKPIPKTQISVYLDKEVAQAFEKFGKKFGKGAKSELVNNFLKQTLIRL